MKAMLEGNFLEHEFHTRLGVNEDDLKKIISDFPDIDDSKDDYNGTIAINNCLNEVCYGIDFSENDWSRWFTVSRNEIVETYKKWASLRGKTKTGIM